MSPMLRSVLSGSLLRICALFRSLPGCCHGECGSQKYTGMPVSASTRSQWAISRPRSQVRLWRMVSGTLYMAAMTA